MNPISRLETMSLKLWLTSASTGPTPTVPSIPAANRYGAISCFHSSACASGLTSTRPATIAARRLCCIVGIPRWRRVQFISTGALRIVWVCPVDLHRRGAIIGHPRAWTRTVNLRRENKVVKKHHLGWLVGVCLAAAATAPLPAIAADPPPSVSSDGLQLQPQKSKHRLVYLKPGATFNQYQRVAILDCFVEFEKDWQKDYNRSRVGLDYKVSDADVERMKKGLAE